MEGRPRTGIELGANMPLQAPISQIHMNLTQEVVILTEDKLRLSLTAHLRSVERKRGWIAPLGMVMSLSVTLTTANFRGALGVESATWRALFFLFTTGCLVWLVIAIKQSMGALSLDDLVESLKRGRVLIPNSPPERASSAEDLMMLPPAASPADPHAGDPKRTG